MKTRRIVSLFGEINGEMFADVANQLIALADESSKPITLMINSDGGDVEQAVALYDFIRGLGVPVDGVVVGLCHSSAVIVLQACRKRYATTNSSFMLHEGSISPGEADSSPTESLAISQWNLDRMRLSTHLIGSRATVSPKDVTELEQRVSFLSPDMAIHYGFADAVVDFVYPKLGKITRKSK